MSARLAANTLIAALTSRSRIAPQGQAHDRTFSGLGPSSRPHVEHVCDVGAYRSIRPKVRPARAALYSSMATNDAQPTSCTDFASRGRYPPGLAGAGLAGTGRAGTA